MPGGREFRILRGVYNVGIGNVEVVCTAEWLDRNTLSSSQLFGGNRRVKDTCMLCSLQGSVEFVSQHPLLARRILRYQQNLPGTLRNCNAHRRHVHASSVPPTRPSRSQNPRALRECCFPSPQARGVCARSVVGSQCRAAPHSPHHDTRYSIPRAGGTNSHARSDLTRMVARQPGRCGILHTFPHGYP